MSNVRRDWHTRLKGDPASWLLDESDNPSVHFWFLRDIIGRPEESPSLIIAQEHILFSDPVQEIFSLQDSMGFWGSPNSLDLPRYSATLWMLALLAELGIARTSRRASLACSFILENHVNSDGAFTGLRDTNAGGLLARSLVYFKPHNPRILPILDRLEFVARQGNLFALWALVESGRDRYSESITEGKNQLAEDITRDSYPILGAFPAFESRDLILALRVLRQIGGDFDPRLQIALERIWARQEDGGRWELEKDDTGMLPIDLDSTFVSDKWATLNVLRSVVGLL